MMYSNLKSNIDSIIPDFQGISLQEVESKNLLNRQDIKFIFHLSLFPDILKELQHNYNTLDINNNRIFSYKNTYFDTPDLKLYHLHHNGKLNRYKVRRRHYIESGITFFELKYKTNKDQTIKKRFELTDDKQELKPELKNHIKNNYNINLDEFYPKLKVDYKRITLIHKEKDEKITLDFDISFVNGEKSSNLNKIVIAEIKQNKIYFGTDFSQIMNKFQIKPMTLSKYCTGIVLTNPQIKHNRFKSKILFINKLSEQNGL